MDNVKLAEKKKTFREVAEEELIEEKTKEFVKQLKFKLKQKQDAKIIVENIEREIADLELKIENEINDIRK